ncbi:hypothetical protein D3C72_1515090 [compost metagenome]
MHHGDMTDACIAFQYRLHRLNIRLIHFATVERMVVDVHQPGHFDHPRTISAVIDDQQFVLRPHYRAQYRFDRKTAAALQQH